MSVITVTESGAELVQIAVVAGFGAALETSTMAVTHLATCLEGCACGGRMSCCPGCGKDSILRHADDCAKQCQICPSAEALTDLVTAMAARVSLADVVTISHEDLALIALTASTSQTMIGQMFTTFADVSLMDDAAAWSPVLVHYETLMKHTHMEQLVSAGGLMADVPQAKASMN